MGRNPNSLLETVRPTIDLFGLWSVEQTEFVASAGSWAAVFQQSTIEVPDGEIWIPISFSCDITTTVIGESIIPAIGIANESNLARVHLAVADNIVSATAQETNTVCFTWNSIQPVTANQFFYAQCHKFDAAGARNLGLDLKFVRLTA